MYDVFARRNTYVFVALPEERISATLSSKRDIYAMRDNTTERHARVCTARERPAYGIRKRPSTAAESVDGSLSQSSICKVHERI